MLLVCPVRARTHPHISRCARCSVRYKLGDTQCGDVWLKYDGKGSFLLIGELETSPIWLASARHARARIDFFSYGKAHRSRKRCKTLNTRLSGASAGDLDRSTRCDRQLSKPIHDLSILCWYLKALPTHHLPWAGFGLGQLPWLIQKCNVEKSRFGHDLEKKMPPVVPARC